MKRSLHFRCYQSLPSKFHIYHISAFYNTVTDSIKLKSNPTLLSVELIFLTFITVKGSEVAYTDRRQLRKETASDKTLGRNWCSSSLFVQTDTSVDSVVKPAIHEN